jgi:diacylglycerol kinase (ATP)
VAIEDTTAPGSARYQAAKMAEGGIGIVVACGGDGTVADVMEGVLGTGTTLSILHLGTGNDFTRTIGVGPDPKLAARALILGKIQRVVGRWQLGERTGHFLNVAGCGFDAVVAERINTGIRRLKGQTAYFAAILQTLWTYRLTEEITDGMLDLVLVGDFRPLEFLIAFPKVLKGTHLEHPKIRHRQSRTLEIESDQPVPYLVDGELLPPGKLTVVVIPAALDVVVGLDRVTRT